MANFAVDNVKWCFYTRYCLSVVRQALMQNQTPEIQAKLLAMQRQFQTQQTGPKIAIAPVPTPVVAVKPQAGPPAPEPVKTKQKPPLTQAQKEDQMRYI